ncbi:MAG: hypothetical protein C4541_02980 [Candidatus Auribacter fodinae]|jgi:cellobiose phosphorylase|uniref:Uncharacterized protein n=1 Tax=Candidatus Auribacter fodinae TaxID=2093366 RepID=A0A3A4RE22_9BACT|nr:MAG: hypothetical protein C4541_02980 [Candidatus Auribacter fodinae]
MKQYGHFNDDGREYIITDPNTPRPWFNYLFNRVYHALVSQTGGGFSYYKDPKTHRILRYEHIHPDRPGRYVFVRDNDTASVWSATWQPMREKMDSYKCVHGLGYSIISTKKNDIATDITYFVAHEDPVEMQIVKVKNTDSKARNLSLYPFVELVSGDIELETVYRNIICLYNIAEYNEELKTIISRKKRFHHRQQNVGMTFFTVEGDISGYETNKEKFYGRYGSIEKPMMLIDGNLSNTIVEGEDMVGVFKKDVTLAPGKEIEFVVVLGYDIDQTKVASYIKKYKSLAGAKAELARVKEYYVEAVNRITVKTPDPNFNLMTNIWGKYQLYAITCWRGTSQYHGGEGGLGYRDTAQDIEGLLSVQMDLAMEKLEKILFWQYNSGHAVSGFSDIEGSWDKDADGLTMKSDVAVWLPYTVISYVKETGNVDFLKKVFKFHNGGEATVYEHILRAVRFLYKERGAHGLPLLRKADWNDAYDHVGIRLKGESVWLGMALARACKQMKELAEFLGDTEVVKEMQEKYDTLSIIINKEGWDGEWYLAAYNDFGRKMGSNENAEGKVPLNSQTWAILANVVPKDRLASILDKIDNYLSTPYGPALFAPVYTDFDETIGRVTAFAPGTKENAAVFSHACAFKIVADCTVGRGDEALESFRRLCPMSPAKQDHDHYKVEPYVWAEYVIGPGNKHNYGEGSFTWNTGTTPWMFIAATEWILGARRDFKGLLIDPCLPKEWKECSIKRPFRGAIYEIEIKNPEGVNKGVKSVTVDGKLIEGNLIKPHGDGKVHKVSVVMGK